MSRYKKLSVDWTREILYSLRLCVVLVLQNRTRSLCSKVVLGVFGGGTRLAMSKTICASDTSSLKTGSGATEGVLDYGVPGRPGYVTWAELMAVKIQDRRPSPVSGWDSLLCGWQAWHLDVWFPFSVNRLCTTLGPSCVFINRRV